MQPPDPYTAEILRTSAPGFAAMTAERLAGRLTASAAFGPDGPNFWRGNLEGRLGDLSVALSEGRAELFSDQVGWSKVAFASRDLPVEALRSSLECLGEVLSEHLPEASQGPALGALTRALEALDGMPVSVPGGLAADSVPGRIAGQVMLALLEGDRRRAATTVLQAVREGQIDVPTALSDVCLAAQRELGRMWHMDEITVAEEHFISATMVSIVSRVAALAEPAPTHGKTVLSASVEGDQHDIGLRVVSELFELDGWRVVFLGAGVPAADLAWAVPVFGADLVVLSAALASQRRTLQAAIRAIRAATDEGAPSVPILVGGPAFPEGNEIWPRIGADGSCYDVMDAVRVGRALTGLDDAAR